MALIFKIILAILGIWFFIFTFTSLANFFNVPVEQYGNYLFFIVVLMILYFILPSKGSIFMSE